VSGERGGRDGRLRAGFTLVELLVVMAIMAALLTLAAPRYFDSLERAKEAALRTDLRILREAIDKHRSDTGRLPLSLEQLVEARYLRAVPLDPITDRADTWVVVQDGTGSAVGNAAGSVAGAIGIADVHSGASGTARDGTLYGSW